jgi:hypothetical protein
MIEEQALVTALASKLPGIAVTVPQLTNPQHATVESGSLVAALPSPHLDIAMCTDGDRTIGCATLLDHDGVVLAGQNWPSERSADGDAPLLPAVTGQGAPSVDVSMRSMLPEGRKRSRRRKQTSVKRRR